MTDTQLKEKKKSFNEVSGGDTELHPPHGFQFVFKC